MDSDRQLERVVVVIPVLNEEATLAEVIASLQAFGLKQIRVVDNGSSDDSVAVAKAAGAQVLHEPTPGYGRACACGVEGLDGSVEWILFCDGDGSDDLSHLAQLFDARDRADLILGDRRATPAGRAVMTPVQNFGNWLATLLIRLGWGHRYRDLGPLRLIRRSALETLQMRDRGFGWTVEMQAKAIDCHLRVCEIPVGYRPRQGGKSKISGTIAGSFKAGTTILTTLARLYRDRLSGRYTLLCAILLLLGAAIMMPHGDFRQPSVLLPFWIGAGIMGVGFSLSWGISAIGAIAFWTTAILSRLLLLPMYPGDDVWRYIWEGYIQNLGFSPYELAPTATELVPVRTPWWELINHPDVSAIYPPLAQFGFRILATISTSVLVFKLAFVIADLATCWLLQRRFGLQKTLLYAWHPIVIYTFAGGAHYDSWLILPMVAAWLLFESRRSVWSSFWVGISVAVKWISLPILAFIAVAKWRVKWMVTVLAIGLLPASIGAIAFCDPNQCSLIPTRSTFVSHGRSAEFFPYFVGQVWARSMQPGFNKYYLALVAIVTLIAIARLRRFQTVAETYFFALLVLSPIVHAWYFTWIVPFAVSSRNLGTRLIGISGFVYFILPHRNAIDGSWHLEAIERYLIRFPFVLGFMWTKWQDSKISRAKT
jgi:glycosyltransferase involved in cell wall biosynthesis